MTNDFYFTTFIMTGVGPGVDDFIADMHDSYIMLDFIKKYPTCDIKIHKEKCGNYSATVDNNSYQSWSDEMKNYWQDV